MELQNLLFSLEHLFDINPLKNYEVFFKYLDLSSFNKLSLSHTGRSPTSPQALVRALVYKNLRGLKNLTELVIELTNNPSLFHRCGFNISKRVPPVERFSSFLRDTDNLFLQEIHNKLVLELIRLGFIRGKYLSIDSCPIPAKVRENNLKTSVKDRFNKDNIPKGDPDARLGVFIHYIQGKQKRLQYFWGYKNHVISDPVVELPVLEVTKPANIHESNLFIPLFRQVKEKFGFSSQGILADAAHDAQYILDFVIKELRSKPFITRNPRHKQSKFKLSAKGSRICIAGLKMVYWGRFKDRNRLRAKFVCPIIHSKRTAQKIFICPMSHPSFFKGKGCTAYLRIDKDIRLSIDYDSEQFKKVFNLRTGSERLFSRLIDFGIQSPSVSSLKAISNSNTLAHITLLLVALTAIKTGNRNKIRFAKTFIQNF